jgi:hypothetical protein
MEPPTGFTGTIDIARMGAVIIDLSGSSQTQPSPRMLATPPRKTFWSVGVIRHFLLVKNGEYRTP